MKPIRVAADKEIIFSREGGGSIMQTDFGIHRRMSYIVAGSWGTAESGPMPDGGKRFRVGG